MVSPVPNPEQPPPASLTPVSRSELPVFFNLIAKHKREYVVFHDGWRGWTYPYPDIARMARALAARFRAHGIGKGEGVMIWSESRPGWVAALWCCLMEGVVLVPVEPGASLALFERIRDRVHPRILLVGEFVPKVESTALLPVWTLFDAERAPDQPSQPPVVLSKDDLAEIVFTSGTTAEPKGVLMTHRNLAASLGPLDEQLAPYRKYLRFLAPLRVLNLLPMSHLFGQAVAMFLVPLVPASVAFVASTNPEEIARQIRTRHMCALISVPKFLEVLRDYVVHRFPETKDAAKARGSWALRWWRFHSVHRLFGWRFCCFISGGAPLPADLEQFWSGLGFVVAQGYGLTETAPIISFSHPFHVQAGTTGTPISGIQVKIAEDGEVMVRGDNVTAGYFELPTETAAAFRNGWLRTGDIGELAPDGALIIHGRKKEVIVTPEGLKVFPEDVEAILNQIRGVRESAVILKEGVHAVLVLEPGFTSEEVVREANRQLEAHQRIRSVSLWPGVELSRTHATQKLRRAEIAAILESGCKPAATAQPELVELVQKYAPGRTITSNTTLEELGLSSLDRVELMMDLEEELEISIDENAMASISTVGELAGPMPALPSIPEPTYNRSWIARSIRRLLLPSIFLPLTRVFARLRVMGREILDEVEGPAIFAANHQSYLDAPAILAGLSRRWRYRLAPAMWKEYFDAHFFPERYSWHERWLNTLVYRLVTLLFNAFPISQVETGTRQSLRYVGELLEEGWSILIFPEGERTLTGEIGKFYPGVAMIASRMHVPVVPIRLIGLDQVLHRNTKWPHRGSVEIRIGAPFTPEGKSYDALAQDIENRVRAL